MTRSRITFSLLGVFLYLFFLLALVPANWVTSAMFPGSASSALSVNNTRGTLWSGSATFIAEGEEGMYQDLGSVTWQLAPSLLLTGFLGFLVSVDGPVLDLKGYIGCGPGGVRMHNVTAHVRLGELAGFHLPTRLLSPSGNATVAIQDFLVRPNEVVGAARLVWKDASVGGGVARGDYELRLLGDAAAVGFDVHTLKGALLVDMKGQLLLDERRLWFAGKIQSGQGSVSQPLAALMIGANEHGTIQARQVTLPPKLFDVLAAARCP